MRKAMAGAVLGLSLLAAWPAGAEVKDAAVGGFTVENVQTVPVDAATAWQALVEDVDRWWPKDHTWWGSASRLSIDARAGGCFCERVLPAADAGSPLPGTTATAVTATGSTAMGSKATDRQATDPKPSGSGSGATTTQIPTPTTSQQALHMTVVFVDPGKTLRMTGGLGPLQGMGLHGALEWRLAPVEGGTRITLFYRVGGYSPHDLGNFAPVVDRVQGKQLAGLADYLRLHTSR